MNKWSEKNKVVNAVIPVADAFDTAVTSDVVNMENYKKLTFLVITGATSTANGVITVKAGVSNSSCATAIVFKYRTQIGAVPPAADSDVQSKLSDATVSGFAMTASKAGGMYVIEVDAQIVAEAGIDYDHVSLTVTEDTNDPQTACIVAILSDPRYADAVLQTAIG